MIEISQSEIERFRSVQAVLTVRIDAALNELMERCVEDVATQTGASFADCAQVSAAAVIAVLLKHLRTAGCPEDNLKQILAVAEELSKHVNLAQ